MNILLLSGGAIAGIVIGIVAVLLLIFAIWYISTHNGLVKKRNIMEEAWATIDVYLKKRYDLVPNLVNTVKGYAAHEKETFQKVTEARAMAMSATTPGEKVAADKAFSNVMRNFNMVMERYPELKANVNFMDLQNQLKSIENELAQARKYYNATAREFNTKIQTFPSSIVANKMKLEKQPYFELDSAEEKKNVTVSF